MKIQQPHSFIRKPFYSALIFFGTLGVLSAGYAGFITLQSSDADSGKSLTSTMMQAVIGNLADLDSRVSTMSGVVSSLQVSAGSLWTTVTGGIGYSAGNVGIGTTTPTASLEIKRTAADGNFAAWIEGNSASNYGLGVNVAGTTSATAIADFKSGNTSRLFVRADGNIGIGTVNPGNKLHVKGGGATIESGNAASPNIGLYISGNSDTYWPNSSIWIQDIGSQPRTFSMGVSANKFTIADQTAASSRLVIDNTGNVGIGTTTPSAKLSVAGDIVGNAQVLKAYMSADFSKAAAWEKLPFNSIAYNTLQGTFDTTNKRFTASRSGYYEVSTAGYSPTLSTLSDRYGIALYKNGIMDEITGGSYSPSDTPLVPFTSIVYLNGTTDYIEIWMFSAIPAVIRGGIGGYGEHLYIRYLGS